MGVGNTDTMSDEDTANATIVAVRQLSADVGIPADLKHPEG